MRLFITKEYNNDSDDTALVSKTMKQCDVYVYGIAMFITKELNIEFDDNMHLLRN